MRRSELKKAMSILVKHGMFLRVGDIELYHGRVASLGESEWEVDPSFDNSGNATGNHNVNNISALSTGSKAIAQSFANQRLRKKQAQARYLNEDDSRFRTEVYQIVSSDPDAVILNRKFDSRKLSEEDAKAVKEALSVITKFTVSKLTPVSFEDRDDYAFVAENINSYISNFKKVLLEDVDIKNVHQQILETNPYVSYEMIYNIASAFNTRRLLRSEKYTASMVGRCFLGNGTYGLDQSYEGFPVNMDYISAWLAHNHIVGFLRDVDSATLDETIEVVSLFDLEKVNTCKGVGEKYQKIFEQYDKINSVILSFENNQGLSEFLREATAEEVMEKMMTTKYEKLFSLDSGVWEGFSVREHTETTLRVFEDTYEEDLPKQVVPFIKLALIAHDIGKGVQGGSVDKNNKRYAERFFQDMGVSEQLKDLLMFTIGDAQKLTSDYYVRKNIKALDKLKVECGSVLAKATGKKPTAEEINGLASICKIIQTCDSGAYTRYGITRDEKTGFYYYNGSDRFTKSFEKPRDISRRKLKLIEPEKEC